MSSALGGEFDKRLRWIRSKYPPGAGRHIVVRTRPANKLKVDGQRVQGVAYHWDCGDTLILIERSASLSVAIDTLLHEYSHALQSESEPYTSDVADQHSPLWGRIFSEIYREYLRAFP